MNHSSSGNEVDENFICCVETDKKENEEIDFLEIEDAPLKEEESGFCAGDDDDENVSFDSDSAYKEWLTICESFTGMSTAIIFRTKQILYL